MSLHQLSLHGAGKKQRAVDEKAIVKYLRGEVSLSEALKLDGKTFDGLRRQAHALYEAGRWQQCIDVLHGLAAMGDVDALDPLLMAGAYGELGNTKAAELCAQAGESMLAKLEGILEQLEQGKTE